MVKENECILFEDIADDFKVKSNIKKVQYKVALVPGNKWSSVTTHVTKGPTLDASNPRVFIRQIEDGFEVEPGEVGVIIMEYYRKPVTPIFNYWLEDIGPDVFFQFDPTGTVHLEWSETLLDVFIYKLGKRYGLTIRDQLLLAVQNLDRIFE